MGYRNKEDCMREAERLGIDVTGLSWAQLQRVVSDALRMEEHVGSDARAAFEAVQERPAVEPAKPERRRAQVDEDEEALRKFYGQNIVIAPELAPERYRLIKYDEDLGNEVELVERKFDINPETGAVYDMAGGSAEHNHQIDEYHDYTTGTYRIKNRSDRRVIGMASVPKEEAGLSFRPGIDVATVVTFKGRSGYLWKHPNSNYITVSGILRSAGDQYFQKYRKVFKDPPNVWYSCGHLVCDPYLVHKVMKEIETDAKEQRDMELARKRALR